MEEIKIIEYNPSYARAVAEMWNRSVEGWNGYNVGRSAETVLREHENSINLHVYLALEGEKVVGYCSFSKFALDEEALYIPLLNVRPDYHGRGVGKALVLQCVRCTIELGWPRLDLFTWPGNTKAVPLYKKCGFFWEERDDSTHLMNFIPSVLRTEAIKDFFADADWYADSTRLIEVKPDGRKVNGFDFLGYSWEKDGKKLRVEFERTGRGLRLIETDDYSIEAEIEDHKLVFGRSYQVRYEIVNKSGWPLEIAIDGRDDKNIHFALAEMRRVTGNTTVTGEFSVGEITEEQNVWRTHPAAVAEITINGRKALFKTGIVPKYPAAVNIVIPGEACHLGEQMLCYLDLENNLEEAAVFSLTLPAHPHIEWAESSLRIRAGAKARLSVPVAYALKDYTSLYAETTVTAQPQDGGGIDFRRNLSAAFRGYTGAFAHRSDITREIICGPYAAKLDTNNNSLKIMRLAGDPQDTTWFFPKLGKPFSSEFSKKKPDEVELLRDGEAMVMKAQYSSEDFPGLRLTSVIRLYASGICLHHYEVRNVSDRETAEVVHLSDTFRHDLYRGVIPYMDRCVEVGETVEGQPLYWDSEKITENWLFSHGVNVTRGITWEADTRVKFDTWAMYFEHDFGRLPAGACARTEPVTVALGLFQDWREFRTFALGQRSGEKPVSADDTEIVINGGNPFTGGHYSVTVEDCRSQGLRGETTVSSAADAFPPRQAGPDAIGFTASAPVEPASDTIRAALDDGTLEYSLQTSIFPTRGGDVATGQVEQSGLEVHYADNGLIRIGAARAFAPTLYSLSCHGEEWLDSPFPTPGMKSWWNPWIGGLETTLQEISGASLLKEERLVEVAALLDSLGNTWRGLKITVNVRKNERYKGLTIEGHYLLLPGSNVMCQVIRYRQHTGRCLVGIPATCMCFLKTGNELPAGWVAWQSGKKGMFRVKAGREERFLFARSPLMYGSEEREDKLIIFTDPSRSWITLGVNNKIIGAELVTKLTAADGESVFTPPVFYIFTKEYLTAEMLQGLRKVRF